MTENFNGNYSIDYSFVSTFIDIGCLVISIMLPWLTIGLDIFDELTKLILTNIESGKIFLGGKFMRYKFRYINGIYRTAAAFAGPFQNFFILWILSLLLFFLIGKLTVLLGIEEYFINDTVWSVLRKIIFICSTLWAVSYCIFRKGVFLYDDHLVIARYTITPTNWKNRIIVNYDDIERVNVNYSDLHFTRYRFSMVVLCGDESYNVELTLKNGKKYFFSIEDQEEFCQNLNSLIENVKDKNI